MDDDGRPRRVDATRCVRPRGAAGGRGDGHKGHLPVADVVLFHAAGCHLCERARRVLQESSVPFREIDITGDPDLEARYREWLPVVEIDGRRAFVYYVDPGAFRRKIAAQS
ncbi:MAG TPA: glutaredoxin family protein [Gaiellaceae bacterium]|nr:glutaredoxin family protein [Gaiellaceae bacterium]